MTVFLDTNILLYSISTDPAEAAKRDAARAIIDGENCALSVQVLQEFYVRATRATRSDPLPHAVAADLMRTWLRFPVQETSVSLLEVALEIRAAHHYAFWDSAIIAAARALGCDVLHSEDMDHGRVVEGVRINNPFR